MAFIKLTAVERRKLTIFFICLLSAITAWLLLSLSNKYEYEVKTVVSYQNQPTNKAFNTLQSDTVLLDVQGSGWQLLFTKLRIVPNHVKVDLTPLKERNFIVFSEQLKQVNLDYSTNQKIIAVHPDTLYFDFTTRKFKKVPIKLISELVFVKQFGQSKKIILKPSMVTISGPKEQLDQIKFWYTDTFKRKKINNELNEKINLLASKDANISIFPNATEVNIPVEEFTEKIISIPIKVINNQEFYDIKLIPDRVNVTLMVPLSDYADLQEDDFEAVVDLNVWKRDGASQLPVKLIKKRPFARLRKLDPLQVNFIVRK